MKKIHIIGGGTFYDVRPHLALAARAGGTLARRILREFERHFNQHGSGDLYPYIHLTWMARQEMVDGAAGALHPEPLITNADVAALIDKLLADPETKAIFLTAALCDFEGHVMTEADAHFASLDEGAENPPQVLCETPSGKNQPRLQSRNAPFMMRLTPADKLVERIRKKRPDILLMACKTTAGAEDHLAMIEFARGLMEHADLALVNDVQTRLNVWLERKPGGIACPLSGITDRDAVIHEIVRRALLRLECNP